MQRKHNARLTPFAKQLRRVMTPEEGLLWHRFLKTYPVKFYRQRVIGRYIVDFYCSKAKLVVELDGGQHYEDAGEQQDRERTAFLESQGLMVIRFTNNDIQSHFYEVCSHIDHAVHRAME